MAYADRRGLEFRPGSAIATLAVTGLILAGVANMAPDTKAEIVKILTGYNVPPEKTVEPPPPPRVEKPRQQVKTEMPAQAPLATPFSSVEPLAPVAPPDPGPAPSGAGLLKPVELPPVAPAPVLRSARLDPRYAANLQPEYPSSAIREGLSGAVTIRVLIGVDGRVKAVEPVSAAGPSLLEATRRQALKSWRFLPATRDGRPVEEWREMTVRFVLPD